jgi:hypothetical protein
MIETNRTKPKKKSVVIDFIKAVSEKSAKQFEQDIISGKLYDDLKPKKKNEKK